MADLASAIKAKAKEIGYDDCGIIEATTFDEFLSQIDKRTELFPHSAQFYDRYKGLGNLGGDADWAKSIIVCLHNYNKYKIPDGPARFIAKAYLFDGRLSSSKEGKARLAFEQYLTDLGLRTKTNAVPARWAAVKAGLAKFRNNNFIYTKHGSWNYVDAWVVDKEMTYEPPIESGRLQCPEGCSKCIDSCPTAALSAPLTMDATRCVTFVTALHELPHTKSLRDKMGTWMYGCDNCQDVCPANANTWQSEETFDEAWPLEELITHEALFSMDEETFLTKIQPRFWYIDKDSIWKWKCNAIRAMANDDAAKYKDCFRQALTDANENVREMAQWAIEKAASQRT